MHYCGSEVSVGGGQIVGQLTLEHGERLVGQVAPGADWTPHPV